MAMLRVGASVALAAVMGIGVSMGAYGTPQSSCAGLRATLIGTEGPDHLRGTPGRDVIWGSGGDDRIEGLGGDDVLCGGPGADRLRGGPGDDIVDGGADRRTVVDSESYEWTGDTLAGGPGDDTLVPGPYDVDGPVDKVTYAAADAGVVVDLAEGRATGEGEDHILRGVAILVGSRHDDRLLGSRRGESIRGGPGRDRIEGRGGDDELDAAGSPRVDSSGREGRDESPNVLIAGAGDDVLAGAQGDDVLVGDAGDDTLYGDLGADRLTGGPGRDSIGDYVLPTGSRPAARQVLDGGAGRDVLLDLALMHSGATGHEDSYVGASGTIDLAAGTMSARAGRDAFTLRVRNFSDVQTPLGTWTVLGTEGANEVIATDDKHGIVIRAGAGNDSLSGTFADDLLDGGPGRDDAGGFIGHDRYVSIEHRIR